MFSALLARRFDRSPAGEPFCRARAREPSLRLEHNRRITDVLGALVPPAIESARHSWEAGDRCARGPHLYLASLDIRDIPFSERDSGVWARRGEGGRLQFPHFRLFVANLPFWAFSFL